MVTVFYVGYLQSVLRPLSVVGAEYKMPSRLNKKCDLMYS